ncbi:MAG: DEAD/DEAH box helicase [Polyangiaceae bacterium]|nr:DEAD/DEAH box helicase [Polyangiaceae bacterium]
MIAPATATGFLTLRSLPDAELRLVAFLALAEPRGISSLINLVGASGLEQAPGRSHTGQSVRATLEQLLGMGLVTHRSDGYWCSPGVGEHALRWAAERQLLQPLAAAMRERVWRADLRFGPPRTFEHARFEALVALAERSAAAPEVLEGAVRLSSVQHVALSIVVPALDVAFDEAWFMSLPPRLRCRLLELGLCGAEAFAYPLEHLYAYVAKHPQLLSEAEAALPAFAGLAILRGDFAQLAKVATFGASEELEQGILGSVAALAGRWDEAAACFQAKGVRTAVHPGVLGFVQALTLLRAATPVALAHALRVASLGSRRDPFFLQTRGVLKTIIQASTDASLATLAPHLLRPAGASDCLSFLARCLFAHWFPVPFSEVKSLLSESEANLQRQSNSINVWLMAQQSAALAALLPKAVDIKLPSGIASLPKFDPSLGVPLTEVRPTKALWEASLEGLERLALLPDTPREEPERLIWKVDPKWLLPEPFLQKRTKSGWSAGRKFALKNLLEEPTRSRLPARDAALSEHVRGTRLSYYTSTEYSLSREAWKQLVGHPLVFVGDSDTPTEVIRGNAQLVLRSTDQEVRIEVEPPNLKADVEARLLSGKIVVFALEGEVKKLILGVGAGLSLPKAAEARALATLERLSHIIPVQSSERTQAKQVPADPKPWFRLLPRNTGLAVSLFTRPLGPKGPEVVPGAGGSTLVSRIGTETLQCLRDLSEERELANEAVRQCPSLLGNDTGDESWQLPDPASSLELMSCLQALSERVHVEWPEGSVLKLKARVARSSLRGRIESDGSFFSARGSLSVEGAASLDLSELLALVQDSPTRFVQMKNGDYLELEQDLRELLLSLSAAGTERAKKAFSVTLPKSAVHILDKLTEEDSGFELDAPSIAWREQYVAASQRPVKLPKGLLAELRPYQLDGFRWLVRLGELGLGACLADDMGLGKTVQAIGLLLHRAPNGPQLVVAPTSVCDNWRRELERFAPSLRVRLYTGRAREEGLGKLKKLDIVIVSYTLLQQDADALAGVQFETAILDEAQFIKNAESLRAQAAFSLTAKFRVVCTGTPVENHVGDLYSLFHFILPDLLGSWPAFNRRFGANLAVESRASTRRALTRLIRPFLLRRTKAQVLQDLPPITEIERQVTLSPEEVVFYETTRTEAVRKLASASKDPRARFQVLAEITRLRRLCCHPGLVFPGVGGTSAKLQSFLELADELRSGGHRALVFSQFVDVLSLARKALEERGIRYEYLDGSTPVKERARAVEAFQSGTAELFLISLRAGGFGLNLTAADYVIHLDPWWNPAVEQQASDRAHRIGQTRPVTVYRLVATGTVEERIVELHQRKRSLANALLEDTDQAASLSVDELKDLLGVSLASV